MKKLFLLTAALLGCTVTPLETPAEELTEESMEDSTTSLDSQLCIEKSGDPTMVVDREFSMTGRVVSEAGEAPFSGEAVDYIYLVVVNDDSSDFDYFYEGAGKIDKAVEDKLYLKLGVLEAGDLGSSAYISTKDEAAILTALNSEGEVTLNMLSASTLGQGASASSVNVCLIQLPE